MELPTHPLLALVESNRNGLKSMLTHYIDDTVDNQFAFLKNHIVLMIQSGQIVPQQSHDATAFGTTLPPSAQIDQLTTTLEHKNILQNEVSQANTINTDDQMIKQEFDDEEEENEDGEEIDDGNVMHCENCEKGICNSVRKNYDNTRDDTDMGESRDEHFETQLIIPNDISPSPSPTNPINSEPLIKQEYPQGSSIAIPLDFNTNANDISIDEVHEPIEGQNTHIQTDEFDDNDDVDDDDYESDQNEYLTNSNCEDCVNGVCDLDHENNNNHSNNEVPTEDGDETDIEHNLDGDEQLQNNILVPKNNQINNQNDEENVINEKSVIERNIEQSTPSTSGVRSSTRKRIPKNFFGDLVPSNVNPRDSAKRKSDQSNESVKKMNRKKVLDNDDDSYSDDQEDEKCKIKIVELHCTEPGCSQISTSRALWREHMWNDHHKRPYHQHESNVQLNHGKYLCTQSNCNTSCTTHRWLKLHWSRNHHQGKYKCPSCLFEANLHYKVRNHFNITHGSHVCTHCGEKFPDASQLKRHKRVHTGERPYKCSWEKCQSSFKQIGTAFQHVRVMHFNLPKTTKEQKERNIIDSRNAHDYIHKD